MKYVAFKKVLSKVVDEEINDMDAIKELFQLIKEKELVCSLTLSDCPKFDTVRIREIGEDGSVNAVISKSGSTLRKTFALDQVTHLELITDDQVLNSLKPGMTRWSLLGMSDSLEDEDEDNT